MKEIKGMITRYDEDKGYGFIWSSKEELDCYFKISNIIYENKRKVEVGDLVSFVIYETDKGYRATNIRFVESGNEKKKEYNGITCWTGHFGEYGLILHKNQIGEGTFLHKSNLIDGTRKVVNNTLYNMDIAKSKDNMIALNTSKIDTNNEKILKEIADNEVEDPRVRLKAIEYIKLKQGKSNEFREIINQANELNEYKEESTTVRIGLNGIEFNQKGSPSEDIITIVKYVVIGGVSIVGVAAAASIIASLAGNKN